MVKGLGPTTPSSPSRLFFPQKLFPGGGGGTIRNDDFQHNPALQCWNNVVTIRNNVATMLQRCVALQIVIV